MVRRKGRHTRSRGLPLSPLRSGGSTLLGFLLGLVGALGGGLWYGYEVEVRRPTMVYLGLPQMQRPGPAGWLRVLRNDAYIAAYSEWRGSALWVSYRVTPPQSSRPHLPRPDRFEHDWRTLRCVTVVSCVTHDDYTGSGYDRGHLAPNHLIATRYGREAQHQTFLMSNIVPQAPALNRGAWQRLEAAEDALSSRFGSFWVITGPIYGRHPRYLPGYKLIALPSAFYKIFVRQDAAGGAPKVLAFVLPQQVEGTEDLRRFLVSVADVQRWTGLDFFHQLPDEVETRIESRIDPASWGFGAKPGVARSVTGLDEACLNVAGQRGRSKMATKSSLACLIVAGAIQGCSTSPVDGGSDRLISAPLAAGPQNAGQLGQATLAAAGDGTAISFFIGGAPAGTTRPLHLYTFIYPGTCQSLGAKPAYEMNEIVTTNPVAGRRGWTLSRRAPVALSALRAGGYAIVVRTSPADGNLDIFCGDIR